MSNYTIKLYNENNEFIQAFKPNKPDFTKVFNEANEIQFSLPANDADATVLELGRRFEILRFDKVKTAGRIIQRDISESLWLFTGVGYEADLDQLCPVNAQVDYDFGSSVFGPNSTTVAGLMEALTYEYIDKLINRDLQNSIYFQSADSEITFEGVDDVGLEKTDTGATEEVDEVQVPIYQYPEITAGAEAGRVTFRFESPDGFEPFRLRWQHQLAVTNDIIYRIRTSQDDGTSWTSWSTWAYTGKAEQNLGWSQETPSREGFPLLSPSGTDWTEVQLQLVNDDGGTTEEPTTRTEGFDELGNQIVIYGSTPVLEAIEIVFRQLPANRLITPHGTDWPEIDSNIYGFEFNRAKHLKIANKVCEKKDFEFYVDEDFKLHLGEQLGEDISSDVVFTRMQNMNIVEASDDNEKQINKIVALGSGRNLNQLKVVVQDLENVKEYGEKPDTVNFNGVEDISELTSKANNELVKRKQPTQKFKIQGVINEDFPGFDLGDEITVYLPYEDIKATGRIIEERRAISEDGEEIILGINDFIDNIVDSIIDDEPLDDEQRKPPIPTQFTATTDYYKIILNWEAEGLGRIYHSLNQSGPFKFLAEAPGDTFAHKNLTPGEAHFYKVSQVLNKKESDKTDAIRATASKPSEDDITKIPPTPPRNLSFVDQTYINDDNNLILTLELSWEVPLEGNIQSYIVERKKDSETTWKEIGTTTDLTYIDNKNLELQTLYNWRIKAQSIASGMSDPSNIVSNTFETPESPSVPQNLTYSIDGDANVYLDWDEVADELFEIYIVETSLDGFATIDKTYYTVNNHFPLTGIYANQTISARVKTKSTIGGISNPSNVVTINMPELLGSVVSDTYTAQVNFQSLLDNHFYSVTDGDFNGENIKPDTVETQALAVGSGTRNFQLVGIEFVANGLDTRGYFSSTSGLLIMVTANSETDQIWNVSAKGVQKALGNQYYVYAHCSKSTTTATIEMSTTQPEPETATHHNFLLGMYFTDKDPALLALSYGFTYIDGNHITTGTLDANEVNIIGAGGKFELNGSGIFGYDSSDNVIFKVDNSGNAEFAGSITAPDTKLFETAYGGVLEMYHGSGTAKIVHLGNKIDIESASNEGGTLGLYNESGNVRVGLSVNDTTVEDYGFLNLRNTDGNLGLIAHGNGDLNIGNANPIINGEFRVYYDGLMSFQVQSSGKTVVYNDLQVEGSIIGSNEVVTEGTFTQSSAGENLTVDLSPSQSHYGYIIDVYCESAYVDAYNRDENSFSLEKSSTSGNYDRLRIWGDDSTTRTYHYKVWKYT